jgi:hypothetical protein
MVYGKTTNSDRARKNQRKSAKLAAEALFIASYAVLRNYIFTDPKRVFLKSDPKGFFRKLKPNFAGIRRQIVVFVSKGNL